jgi:hypothetical protein
VGPLVVRCKPGTPDGREHDDDDAPRRTLTVWMWPRSVTRAAVAMATATWDPVVYMRFGGERTQAAVDLGGWCADAGTA